MYLSIKLTVSSTTPSAVATPSSASSSSSTSKLAPSIKLGSTVKGEQTVPQGICSRLLRLVARTVRCPSAGLCMSADICKVESRWQRSILQIKLRLELPCQLLVRLLHMAGACN